MQFESLSLNTNARMYLYNTPRDTMSKDPMFHNLCSTSIWNAPGIMPNTSNSYNSCALELMLNMTSHNSCAPELALNTKSNHSCDLELALNTKSHHSCASVSTTNTLYNSIMHSVFCTFYHHNHLSICI